MIQFKLQSLLSLWGFLPEANFIKLCPTPCPISKHATDRAYYQSDCTAVNVTRRQDHRLLELTDPLDFDTCVGAQV